MSQTESKVQRIVRRVETCEACGAVDRFRVYATTVKGANRVSYAKCACCGHKAVVRYIKH